MDAKKVASRIVQHWEENAGVGNTRSVLNGAGATNAFLIVATKEEAERHYVNVRPHHVMTLEDVEKGSLDHRNAKGFPLIIDNGAAKLLLTALVEAKKAKKDTVPKSKDV